jgi:hypothetical protein
MNSKNKPAMTAREREHVERVKELPCSVCNAPGPSEAHELKQGLWWVCCALCPDCHRGPVMGWHGQKRAWAVRKMDELQAVNVTLERLAA